MAIVTKIAGLIANKWVRATCQIVVILAMALLGA